MDDLAVEFKLVEQGATEAELFELGVLLLDWTCGDDPLFYFEKDGSKEAAIELRDGHQPAEVGLFVQSSFASTEGFTKELEMAEALSVVEDIQIDGANWRDQVPRFELADEST